MYIYKTTNLINSKIYIGKSKNKFNPNYFGSGSLLRKAIKKYGILNFGVEILDECDNINDLDRLEIFWICKFNSQDREIGYNITDGGTGGDTYTNNPNYPDIIENLKKRRHTEETKKKISENNWQKLNKGELHFRYGTKHSEETKKKISDSHMGKCYLSDTMKKKLADSQKGELGYWYGKKRSDETKENMRKSSTKGKPHKKVQCPYCDKIGGYSSMQYWHFDRCRNKL
jgi:group I intron endonuclease